jgi:4-amino-4-deoxy-L-arabinose transferase-like glycosyltransferase
MTGTKEDIERNPLADTVDGRAAGRYLVLSLVLILLHAGLMVFRCGQLPIAPAVPDEVIINDASISLARGQGYVASSLTDSKYGLDHLFAHFPPLYPYTEAVAFRVMGVSAESLRATTILMSILSTVVLFLLLYRLCKRGLLHWSVALLIEGLYCTNASLIALERMARMESMISVLMLLSLWGIVCAATYEGRGQPWAAMLGAGIAGALCMAVHPEAMTALLLLGALMLFAVPVARRVRLASVGLFVVVPVVVGLLAFRAQLVRAVEQFVAIARDSMATNPTSRAWLMDALRNRDLSRMNRNAFLMLIMLLLAMAPVVYATTVRRLPRTSVRHRLGLCFGVVGILEILLMVFVLRMDDRRCQFLFGSLLVCNALCLMGASPLRRWQSWLGWGVVALQCLAAAFYLSPRSDRVADMNPDRYTELVRGLPAGMSVASTPGLWLDLEEQRRPFTLILYGLDGESAWSQTARNPLDRFDVVILEKYYARDKPWWAEEAKPGRTKSTYTVGSDVVDVYVRNVTVDHSR